MHNGSIAPGSVRAFLFGVAHNILRSHHRKASRGRIDRVEELSVADMASCPATAAAMTS